jgi:hypothetical protein
VGARIWAPLHLSALDPSKPATRLCSSGELQWPQHQLLQGTNRCKASLLGITASPPPPVVRSGGNTPCQAIRPMATAVGSCKGVALQEGAGATLRYACAPSRQLLLCRMRTREAHTYVCHCSAQQFLNRTSGASHACATTQATAVIDPPPTMRHSTSRSPASLAPILTTPSPPCTGGVCCTAPAAACTAVAGAGCRRRLRPAAGRALHHTRPGHGVRPPWYAIPLPRATHGPGAPSHVPQPGRAWQPSVWLLLRGPTHAGASLAVLEWRPILLLLLLLLELLLLVLELLLLLVVVLLELLLLLLLKLLLLLELLLLVLLLVVWGQRLLAVARVVACMEPIHRCRAARRACGGCRSSPRPWHGRLHWHEGEGAPGLLHRGRQRQPVGLVGGQACTRQPQQAHRAASEADTRTGMHGPVGCFTTCTHVCPL